MLEILAFGYIGIFVLSFFLNLLPFLSPSNMVLSGAIALSLPESNPFLVGLLVAFASSSAKIIHYCMVHFLGKTLSPKRKIKLENYSRKLGKFGSIFLFITAASPIPDEPLVISLGLLRYNPIKFFLIFLLGKISITIPGAYLGSHISLTLSNLISNSLLMMIAIALTGIVTYLLVKADLEKIEVLVMKIVKKIHLKHKRRKS